MKKIFIAFALLLTFLVVFYTYSNNSSEGISSPPRIDRQQKVETKVFRSSDILNIELIIPAETKVSENYGSVIISSGTEKINIGRNGTNHDNLDDYINFSKNHLKESTNNFTKEIINEYESINGMLNDEKVYFIYTDNQVFILSTSSPELYDDLDQIAQSFKYLGD